MIISRVAVQVMVSHGASGAMRYSRSRSYSPTSSASFEWCGPGDMARIISGVGMKAASWVWPSCTARAPVTHSVATAATPTIVVFFI